MIMKKYQMLGAKLAEKEAAILVTPENRRYYTSMNTSNGLLVVTRDDAQFFTDFRYITDARERVEKGIKVDLLDGTHANTLKKSLEGRNITRIYFEEKHLNYAQAKAFMDAMPDVEFAEGDALSADLRMIKSDDELDSIKAAQKITDAGYTHILDFVADNFAKGITEKDLAFELEFFMRRSGSGNMPFDIIAASGENTAKPHAVPTDRKLREGDFVTLDFGSTFNGYCSDMTRTFAIGYVTDEMENIYNTVAEAQKKAIEGIHAGMTGTACDALARDVIKAAGYGEYFGHSLGHSVGLQVHEAPNFSPAYIKPIPAGTILSVEPGIYIADQFGVRIEDLVIVREDGVEDITGSDKHLTVIR